MSEDRLITVQDVYNVIAEHMQALDTLWPDSEQFGPRKVHIVELIDAIKLRLIARAEKNANRYESPFEKAAKKITGSTDKFEAQAQKSQQPAITGKSAMQLAHEAAQTRIKR